MVINALNYFTLVGRRYDRANSLTQALYRAQLYDFRSSIGAIPAFKFRGYVPFTDTQYS